jgi:hypothetical protein
MSLFYSAGQFGAAIPDSQVLRSADTNSTSGSGDAGPVINPNVDLNGVKAEISENTADATAAYIRDSNDNILGQTDISGLSSGDTFQIDGVSMTSGSDYLLTLDAEGSQWTVGFYESPTYPYETGAFDIVRQRKFTNGEDTSAFPAVDNIRNLDY